jgi:hypothetical protein
MAANRALSFTWTSIKAEADRCQKELVTASCVLCDCEALATLQFRSMHKNFLKPGDFDDISISRVLSFVQSGGLLSA